MIKCQYLLSMWKVDERISSHRGDNVSALRYDINHLARVNERWEGEVLNYKIRYNDYVKKIKAKYNDVLVEGTPHFEKEYVDVLTGVRIQEQLEYNKRIEKRRWMNQREIEHD